MNINPKSVSGNWKHGWALDVHTVKSEHLGVDQFGHDVFENTRSEIGEAIFKLKNRSDKGQVDVIAEAAAEFIKSQPPLRDVSVIIPVPPSDTARKFQPVNLIAEAVADKLGIESMSDYLKKIKQTAQLKNMDAASKRKELDGAFEAEDDRYEDQHVLVLDDLFGTGETLRAITQCLSDQGKVAKVSVLTMTMNRSRR